MTPYTICVALTILAFLACLFRARLLALAILPGLLLVAARSAGLVDISSASHPLRLAVPLVGMSVALWSAWRSRPYPVHPSHFDRGAFPEIYAAAARRKRRLAASLIVFASGCADIAAVKAWLYFGEWVTTAKQIVECVAIVAVLLVPERWVARCLR